MATKERYRQSRDKVFEVMGIDPNDRRFNCHHIVGRAEYRHDPQFWDNADPKGHFDVDGESNLFPVRIEEHRRINELIETAQLPRRRRKRR